ncbi:NlpC/P60 family protein [uncultured Paracoccus sp.]|uniref:C40 family peptidase n=1 Tax=uncultured Paracoccus sp. TaxID=189685 RepID=UPI00260A7C07|nr:NlpC/P60 family protein [uncultured Paracoccus sp.]
MDRRLTPATERTALRGSGVERPVTVDGTPMRVAVPLADLCRAPAGARDRQVVFGSDVTVIERRDDWAFVQAAADGYCGWIAADGLSGERPAITHRVSAPATHVYPGPGLKLRESAALTLGARLSVERIDGTFARLAGGGHLPVQHIAATPAGDPVTVALSLLGTPYLWGGNSRAGIDCSGLVQAALHACAIACPGDSDLQEAAFPTVSDPGRGDLLFWPGHVAMVIDAQRMVHATAWAMAVVTEDIAAARARIDAGGDGPFRGARRPLARPLRFP